VKRIVEIVPASPGWYARRRFTPESPGGADNDPGADFIRYIHQTPEDGSGKIYSTRCSPRRKPGSEGPL
jgi:hypothetical protein